MLSRSRLGRWICMVCLSYVVTACSQSRTPDAQGGETHFLAMCQGGCPGDLSCVCGVCTLPCKRSTTCSELAEGVDCLAIAGRVECADEPAPMMACDIECRQRSDCGAEGLACMDRRCRPEALATTPLDRVPAGDSPETIRTQEQEREMESPSCDGDCPRQDPRAACRGDECASPPLVMLLVDTSGSMERTPDCVCTTPSCDECLPDCAAAERNRWATVLEALTGTFDEFACERRERTPEEGASYDLGYYLPYHAVSGAQADDGLLDTFVARLRFGVATFDSWDTYLGQGPLVSTDDFRADISRDESGMWSYAPQDLLAEMPTRGDGLEPGVFMYPTCEYPYRMDTGIRSGGASEGALQVALDAGGARQVNASIQDALLRVRPYGGTPIAAALDDLYYVFHHDPALEEERVRSAGARHVILITDGYPDDDYRAFGCDCTQNDDEAAPGYCGGHDNDPSDIRCPYPLSAKAARRLRCGDDDSCDNPLVSALHVVALSVSDPEVRATLDDIARAGGTGAALHASSTATLRSSLQALMTKIASTP